MDDEGNMKKESNARFVKWSDGSFSLHLGAEIFDVYKQPLQVIFSDTFQKQKFGIKYLSAELGSLFVWYNIQYVQLIK